MFENHFKTAWRNLLRNKTFSTIKILGLSIGLTVCMLIFLYTKDENSYDRFHENETQLYRVTQNLNISDQPVQTTGNTNAIVGETFAKEIPEVQQFVRVRGVAVTMKKTNDVFAENILFVDNNFLSVFTFKLVDGDKRTALQDPHSMVISESMAKKYFGSTDVVGKVMQMKADTEFENFTITAVIEDWPQNSTLKTDILVPYEYHKKYNRQEGWMGGNMNTFLLLASNANVKTVESKMQAIFHKNTSAQIAEAEKEQGMSIKVKLALQPLASIHLNTEIQPGNGMNEGSNPVYSYILTCIGVFILIMACINFINLAVAQSLRRSKEIGIRKVVGSTRKQLIRQFLVESFVVSLVAFIIAVGLTMLVLPFFNELANKKLSLAYLSDGYLYAGYFLLLLVTAFVSGFYPSLVLSSFQPVKVLYSREKIVGRNYLTKGLIVLQFALAIFLIIGTFAINSQLNFLKNADLGYDTKNLVRLELSSGKSSDKLPALFKNELLKHPSVLDVAARNSGTTISGVKVDGRQIEIGYSKIDDRYFPAFKIPIIAGRNFSPDFPADTLQSVIVNESFVRQAGWKINEAVGKRVGASQQGGDKMTVIGVVKDYHSSSLREKISPQVFSMEPSLSYGEMWVKIKPGNIPVTLAMLETTYTKLVPFFPYSHQFMDDINARNYETDAKWKQIIVISSGLFIFISCIGLFGLVMLSIEQRRKEIGIRKVLGAAVSRIIVLISREFLVLVSIAFIVAVPAGYYFIDKWLQDFAYRVEIGWWMFAAGGILAIAIAFLTMSFQAIKAAIANPVKSLKSE